MTITDAVLAQAVDDAASRLQASYASGCGRMAFPTGQLEQGLWAECGVESLPIGTNDSIATKMTAIDNAWREFARGPGDGHRLVSVAAAVSDLYLGSNAITAATLTGSFIKPFPWAPVTNLAAGTSSVGTAKIMRWLEFRNQEVDDRQTLSAASIALWRRMSELYTKEVPEFDVNVAWAWETSPAVAQCIYAFYYTIGNTNFGANMQNAQILVLGDPASRSLTVHLADATTKLWAVWQVGLVRDEDGAPSMERMRGKQDGSLGTGQFVGVRGVAYGVTSGTLANTWDIRRLESLLSPKLRQSAPSFDGAVTTLTSIAEQAGALQTVTTAYPQDGALRRYTTPTAANVAVADVVRRAIPITSFDNKRGGLRPHAALAVALGKGFGVKTSGKHGNDCRCGGCNADVKSSNSAGSAPKMDPHTARLIAEAISKMQG